MMSSSHRIFVSHSHLDNEFGMKLAQDLRHALTEESAVFYDVMGGLHGGDSWWNKIVEELTTRDVFLLILSPDAMTSRWVLREIDIALNEDKLILPLLYRTCTIRADLKTIQIISFLAPKLYEAAFQEVLVALHLPVETLTDPQKPIGTGQHQNPTLAARLMQQIETAFMDHDWPDVIRKADYLSKTLPESMNALLYRWQGVALLEEGEEEKAQEAFQTALALVSDRQERLTLLSDYTALLVRQHQWAQVLQRSREALRLVPQDAAWQAMQQQAQDQLAPPTLPPSQKPEQREENPHHSKSLKTKDQWINEGNALRNRKQSVEALSAYEQAIRLDSNYAVAYYNKGAVLNDLKRYEDALSAYEQAIRLNPTYVLAYNSKGNALYYLKRYEEALTACEQAIHLDPTDALAYRNKGWALYGLKRYEEALTACEQAIRLDPTDANTYSCKGNTLYDLKRYEEALTAFEQTIRLGPTDANAYNSKGLALERLGKKKEAQNAYNKARQLGYNG